MSPTLARALWHRLETINAVTYFCPERRDAPRRLGLKGFWMGYFSCRAAPLGPVGPGVVEATFFNFHPSRVRRAIPDAWAIASPDDLLAAGADAAATGATALAVSSHMASDEDCPGIARFFQDVEPPASTWVGVTELMHPDFLIEIEAVAALPD